MIDTLVYFIGAAVLVLICVFLILVIIAVIAGMINYFKNEL